MRTLLTALLLFPAIAGCLSGDATDGDLETPADAMAAIGSPIEIAHDHNDLSLHTASHNVDFLSWNTLDVTLGDNGFANFVLWTSEDGDERLVFVAVDGDDDGGFVIADISDPLDVQVLGSYMVPGNSFQEVRVTPDGRFVVLNVQDLNTDPAGFPDRIAGSPEYCGACIHVVNVQDRTAPTLSSYTPVELLGTHNMDFFEGDDGLYLYYVGQPLSYEYPTSTPGQHIWIADFLDMGDEAVLTPMGSFSHDTSGDDGRAFPHDVLVRTHPVTGQDVAYVSYWDAGAITFDVSDPTQPVELDVEADPAPSDELAIHWFSPEEWTRLDGRVYAWSAPEIGALESGTGVVRGYDVTDPADIQQVGTWELPGDDLFIERAYILSPHAVTVDPETAIAAVSHYHAGVWLLDVSDPSDPRHVGFYTPHGDDTDPYTGDTWWKKPNFDPEGYAPNVYMARWDDRGDDTILWVTDRSTGLYALQYSGDTAKPIA